ncbi:MAG: P-loop NTPase fold protein, partial [Acidobacteriota bacterium]
MNKIESDQPVKFFISYAPEDIAIASNISRHLEGDGINVYDPYRYTWDIALDPEQIVNETDGVIIIMSPRSMPDRARVTRQWLPFLRHQKGIYPVILEECQLQRSLYLLMWFDARRGLVQALPKLIEALRQYVPTPQPNLTDQSKVAVTDPPPTEPAIDSVGRRVGLSREAIDNNAVNDKPLTDVSQDKLGFAPYVFGLKEFLDSLDTETPLTIGLNGAWGSGKSSMMRMLESELKKRTIHGTFAARAKWTLDWIRGTWWVGLGYLWLLILKLFRQTQRAEDIGTALHFGRSIPNMVTNEFDAQFHKFINLLIDDDAAKNGQQQMSTEERARHLADYQRRLEKWARRSYLRVMMPPARHYCVWFNAWKYSDQDQIWAALALATLRQLAKEKSLPGRVFIILRQTIRNLRTLNGNPLQFVQKNVLPALVAIAPLIYGLLE